MRVAKKGELDVSVISALNSDHICDVRRLPSDSVASLRQAVASASLQAYPFDLINKSRVLDDSSTLQSTGVQHGTVLQLMRRELRALDISVYSYSESCLGCLAFVYHPTGYELLLRGARVGSDKCC